MAMTTASRSSRVNAPDFLAHAAREADAALDRLLPKTSEPCARLHEAMRYSALSPGKRLRPALALAACRAFGGDEARRVEPAAALEMIHAYSLVHDDLPAMDDDDLRRGRPTSHVVFGEAMAILVGDGLHTLACEVLAEYPLGDEHALLRARVQRHVLRAIGWRGMVGGQAIDMELTGRGGAMAEDDVRGIHARKTAALIRAALLVGAEIGCASAEDVAAMGRFGDVAGLAFQVVDDVLDMTKSSEELGKSAGKDAQEGKVTYPAVLGLEVSRQRAAELTEAALAQLASIQFPSTGDAEPLRGLTRYILERAS
jgi:geranylgeranyl pyrophosphate synthase